VTAAALKLTVYFGEHDRYGGRLTSDVLHGLYQANGVPAAILLCATEGFGVKHRLHTQRMLTLSEDLPLVSIAVAPRATVEALVPDVQSIVSGGLITLERARLLASLSHADAARPGDNAESKLTLYLGRLERVGREPAYAFAIDVLRRHGVAGATAFLGVDGLVHGARARARFLSRNAEVPLVVISVGAREAIAAAGGELERRLSAPLATLERVRVCKRDGHTVAPPLAVKDADARGLGLWHKLTVYTSEWARHDRHPLYVELIRRLRLEGASGATAIRGVWGFSGSHHPPHGDTLLALRRHVPVVLTIVDRPARAQSWWRLVDALTPLHGLVTSEVVPASRAVGPGIADGGLALAEPDALR
jgi:PII-like signaling protein